MANMPLLSAAALPSENKPWSRAEKMSYVKWILVEKMGKNIRFYKMNLGDNYTFRFII